MKKIISLFICAAAAMQYTTVFAITDTPSENPTHDPVSVTEASQSQDMPGAADSVPTESPSVTPTERPVKKRQVTVDASVIHQPYTISSDIVLELYSSDNRLISSKAVPVNAYVSTLSYTFDIPESESGTDFKLHLADGAEYLEYNSQRYYTSRMIDFTVPSYGNASLALNIMPRFEKSVAISCDGKKLGLYPEARLINETTMIPIRDLAEYMGFDVSFDEERKVVTVSIGYNSMYFNVGTAYSYIFGNEVYAPQPTMIINGTAYVALRTFADAAGCTIDVKDNYTSLDVNISSSSLVSRYNESRFVNDSGISSRTSYMVWVSKHEYKVRLYMGKQYDWQLLREMPCALGAPGSPTITGSFEFKYTDRWNYNGYYVGPCLVFYGGYALHSVLLRYDGSEYDGRVGVQISHGCIRMKKKDIDYIASLIPVGTRIYITE